ncbi:DNA-directed RNA polymerase II core subunit rpb9 [Thoreauomyces humboldtii]|nr:DNA-directed RNA polymerase II core subunit rpb9 [Thoreauomyces humboldtii]
MASFRFCSECNNLLYPREERAARKLVFGCRHCSHEEDAEFTQVYEHVVSAVAREQKIGGPELASDPTFPKVRIKCPKCDYMEAVFFHSRSKSRDATMKLTYCCASASCGHTFSAEESEGIAPMEQ